MEFVCVNETSRKTERWRGEIIVLKNHGTHYEFRVESRSSILVIFGKTTQGWFACMPDFGAGCHLVNSKDRFWNTEKLSMILGKVDGITVASALFAISDHLTYGLLPNAADKAL